MGGEPELTMKRFTQLVENSKPICEKLIKVLDGNEQASLEAKPAAPQKQKPEEEGRKSPEVRLEKKLRRRKKAKSKSSNESAVKYQLVVREDRRHLEAVKLPERAPRKVANINFA